MSTIKIVICERLECALHYKDSDKIFGAMLSHTFIGLILYVRGAVIHLNLKRPDKYNLSFTHYLYLEMISRFWSARIHVCVFDCVRERVYACVRVCVGKSLYLLAFLYLYLDAVLFMALPNCMANIRMHACMHVCFCMFSTCG